MRVSFVYRGSESLAISYLSACLKQRGHDSELIFDPALFDTYHIRNKFISRYFSHRDIIVKKIIQSNSKLIAFSLNTEDYLWACDIVSEVKKSRKDILIIFGGVHPTAVPEYVIKHDFVDYVCVGEGEEALAELCDNLEKGGDTTNIPNIWARSEGKVYKNEVRLLQLDLDILPFPDKDLFFNEYKGLCSQTYLIQTGRGCLYSCTYCYGSYIRDVYKDKGCYLRRRSIDSVLKELEIAKKKYNPKEILFCDDIFIHDQNWLSSFLPKYKALIGIPFVCLAFPALKEFSDDIIKLLKDSGCRGVNIGVQSICEKQRKKNLDRPGTNLEISNIIKRFNQNKLYLCVDIIVGLPFQDRDELIEAIKFFNKFKPYAISVSWLRYFPKTKIGEIAKKAGILSPQEFKEYQRGKVFSTSIYRQSCKNKEIAQLSNLLIISGVLPEFMLDAILKFKIYRVFPIFVPHFLMLWIRILFIKLIKRPKQIVFLSFSDRIKFHAHYLNKIIIRKISGNC